MTNSTQSATMTAERPTDILKNEHRIIERVLDALEHVLEEPRIDPPFIHQAVDFLRNFADGCHHTKEEEQLFPMLESHGMSRQNGPIGCMLNEHEMGRALIRVMSEKADSAGTGDSQAAAALRQAARQYIELLRHHIQKEDNVLFFMADRILDQQHQNDLMHSFDTLEQAAALKADRIVTCN